MTDKVLILDDEPEIADILGALLEERYPCKVFIHADEALQELAADHYSLVITDIEMPDRDGVQFITAARTVSPSSRIFISTGHDQGHPRVQSALAAGAVGVIYKPFADIDELVATLGAEV